MTLKNILLISILALYSYATQAKPIVILQSGDDPYIADDAVVYCGGSEAFNQKFYQCSISRCAEPIPTNEFFCSVEGAKWSSQLKGDKTKTLSSAKKSALVWAGDAVYRNLICDLATLDEVGKEIKRVSIPNVDLPLPDLK